MSKGIGGHHQPYRGRTDEWLTPPEIIAALGAFDLDPCSPIDRPWPTAARHYTIEDNGLATPWRGRVWLNPPYGPESEKWLATLALHKHGTALVFARTETSWFFDHGWESADAMLFLRGRLHFHHLNGERAKHSAGAPSVLIAYGAHDATMLSRAVLDGTLDGSLIDLTGVL